MSTTESTWLPPNPPRARPGPPGGRRDANRQARLGSLCEGALGLFLSRGIDGVSVEEIAQSAGLSKAAFYRYFQHKPELVATLFQPLQTDLEATLDAGANDLEAAADPAALLAAYDTLNHRLVPTLLAHERLVRLFLQERHGTPSEGRAPVHQLAQIVLAQVIRMTHASRAHGLLRDVDPEVSAIVVLGATTELISATLRGAYGGNPVLAAATVVDVILFGVRRRDAHASDPTW